MKLAVISDIHSNILAFNLALNDIHKEQIERCLFLGDYITDGEGGNEILDIIKNKSKDVILGNREKYILNYSSERKEFNNYKTIANTYNSLSEKNIEYIKTLEEFKIITVNDFKILLIHGDKYFNLQEKIEAMFDRIIADFDFDICLFGHTHQYLYQKYKGKIFINPGSMGQSVDTPTYKYCILDIGDNINVILKEFKVADTFDELENKYKNSNYYKENYVWGDIILKIIRDSRDYSVEFLSFFNEKIKEYENINAEEFNKMWNDTYKEFLESLL